MSIKKRLSQIETASFLLDKLLIGIFNKCQNVNKIVSIHIHVEIPPIIDRFINV